MKTGWCLTDHHDQCPFVIQLSQPNQEIRCECDCHKERS